MRQPASRIVITGHGAAGSVGSVGAVVPGVVEDALAAVPGSRCHHAAPRPVPAGPTGQTLTSSRVVADSTSSRELGRQPLRHATAVEMRESSSATPETTSGRVQSDAVSL
jgi:hypothetical protein